MCLVAPLMRSYYPTGVSPDELLPRSERLRSEAEAEIERLIDILDRTNSFFDEREHQVDDDPIDGDDNCPRIALGQSTATKHDGRRAMPATAKAMTAAP